MRVINRVCDYYRVYPRELLDGPEGPADDLPWNADAPHHQPRRVSDASADPCLTVEQVAEYAAALARQPELLRWLREKHGVSYRTARACGFGYGKPLEYRSAGLVMPIAYPVGTYTYRLRQWPVRRPKEVPPRGQPLAVWPHLPTDDALVILVEGPLTAACLRQREFNAYAVCGASQYGLCKQVGEHSGEVVLLWDVGAEKMADIALAAVRDGGAKASRVDLGLDANDGPEDWFVKHHRSAGGLWDLINAYREAQEGRRR